MADLDDFFAKKDRKKAKGKKFTTTDEIAKKLEETGKRVDVKLKLKEKTLNSEDEEIPQSQEEDEWKVFEEEKKDYTGLKIGNLAISENPSTESDTDRGASDNYTEPESGEPGSKQSGPWKKADQPPGPEPQPQPQVVQQAAPAPTSAASGTYKAPHMRNSQPTIAPLRQRSAKNVAPDINNKEYFPTLNSAQTPNDNAGPWARRKRDEGTFEEVRNRSSNRYAAPEAQVQTAKLTLGNKYGALSQDQS